MCQTSCCLGEENSVIKTTSVAILKTDMSKTVVKKLNRFTEKNIPVDISYGLVLVKLLIIGDLSYKYKGFELKVNSVKQHGYLGFVTDF